MKRLKRDRNKGKNKTQKSQESIRYNVHVIKGLNTYFTFNYQLMKPLCNEEGLHNVGTNVSSHV